MKNDEKLKIVFDFIHYYLTESDNNGESNTIKKTDMDEKTNGVNPLNQILDVQRANELIKTIQVRDNLNANVNRVHNDYERKLKTYFNDLKKDFVDDLKQYNDEDEIIDESIDEVIVPTKADSIVISDNVIVTPKPVVSILDKKSRKSNVKK